MDRNCEECGKEPSIVGWGTPPIWLGLECYEAKLDHVVDIRDRALEAMDPRR